MFTASVLLVLILAGVDVDDSLSKFSSKSLRVIGRLRMALSVMLRSPLPVTMRGFDGVVIIEEEANGT